MPEPKQQQGVVHALLRWSYNVQLSVFGSM